MTSGIPSVVTPPLLHGIRVLDLSRLLAGPFATVLLADLGAEVIKLENPPLGDPMRYEVEPVVPGGEDSVYFASVNHGKKSVAIDLKNPEGLTTFYDLVRLSDVVLDNFRPGVVEKLKIDYPRLREINPRIITCSISGFGQNGPDRDGIAVDLCLQAMSGTMHLTGTGEEGASPLRMGLSMADLGGALFAVIGTLGALIERERTGVGRQLDVALLDSIVALLTYMASNYLVTGEEPAPVGSGHHSVVPYQAFEASDGWLVIACLSEKFYPSLCVALQRPDLVDDPRFRTNALRSKNRDQLVPTLQRALHARSRREWLDLLREHDVPSAPVNTVGEALRSPQLLHRGMIRSILLQSGESLAVLGNPVKVSGTDGLETPTGPDGLPLMGEHTVAVLAELLGYSAERISGLAESGAIRPFPEHPSRAEAK